jgi:hypothetical protein
LVLKKKVKGESKGEMDYELPYVYMYFDWNINKYVIFSVPSDEYGYYQYDGKKIVSVRQYKTWDNIIVNGTSLIDCLEELYTIINKYKAINRLYINKKDIKVYYMILDGEELIEIYNNTLKDLYTII